MELASLDRAALQALAKQHGIKANLRTSAIIAQLEAVVVDPSSSSAASCSKQHVRRASDSSLGRPQRRSPTKAGTRPRTRKSVGSSANYCDEAMDQDTDVAATNADGGLQREQRSFASDALPVMATARASLPDASTPATCSRKRKSWDGADADLGLEDDFSARRRSRQRTMEPTTPVTPARRSRSVSRQRSKSEDLSDASDASFEFSESPGDDSADSTATTPEKDSPPLEVKTLPEDLDLVFKLASDIDTESEPATVAPPAPARPTTSGLRLAPLPATPAFTLDPDLTDLVDSFPVCVPRPAQTLGAKMGWEIGKFPWTAGSHVEHTSIVAHDAREQLREQAMRDLLDDLRERRDRGEEHSGDVDLELLCASGGYFDPQPNRVFAPQKERKPIERVPLTSLPRGALRYVIAKSRFGRHYAATAHPWNRTRGAVERAVTAERAELRAIRLEAGLDPDLLCAPGHDPHAAAEVLSAYPAPDYASEPQDMLHNELAFALGQIPEQTASVHDDDMMEEVVATGFEERTSSPEVESEDHAVHLTHDEDADADGEWEYETGAEWGVSSNVTTAYASEPVRDGDRSGSSSPSSSSEPDVEDEHAAHMLCNLQQEPQPVQPRKEMVTYTLPTMPMCASACSSSSQESAPQQQQQQTAMEIDSAATFGFQQPSSTEQAQSAVQQLAYPFNDGYEWTESSFSVGQPTTQTQPLTEQEFFQDFFTHFNVDTLNAQVQQQGINPQLTQLNPASGAGYFQPQPQHYEQFLPAHQQHQQYLPTTSYEYFGSDVPPPTPRAVGETAHEPFGFDLATLHQQQTHDMDMMQLDVHHPHQPEQDEWAHAREAEDALAEQGLFAPAIPEHHVAPAVFAQRTTAASTYCAAAVAGWAAHLIRARIGLLTGPTRVGVPRPYPPGAPVNHPNARDPALPVLGRACERDGERERAAVGLELWCGGVAGVWETLEMRRREGRACASASAAGWRGAPFGGGRGVAEMVDMGGFAHGV